MKVAAAGAGLRPHLPSLGECGEYRVVDLRVSSGRRGESPEADGSRARRANEDIVRCVALVA